MEKAPKMDVEFRYGQMAQDMTGFGAMAWQTDTDDSCTPRAMSTKVSGPKIKPMVMEYTPTSTAAATKDNGSQTSSTDSVLNNGPMAQSMMDNTNRE